MRVKQLFIGLALTVVAGTAAADLEPWTDYDISGTVSNVTTVKVDSNMIDRYLEGLSKTWAPAAEVAKELGQIEDYAIYVSDLPNSGHFNVVLVMTFSDAGALQPIKENFDAFMEAWGEANQEMTEEMVETYPAIRTMTGEYLMREITLK